MTQKTKVQPNCHCVPFRDVGGGWWLLGPGALSLSSSHVAGEAGLRPLPLFTGTGSGQGLEEINFRLEQNSQSSMGSESPNHLLSPRGVQEGETGAALGGTAFEVRGEQHGEVSVP